MTSPPATWRAVCCPLAAFGHNRDGKKGKMQVTYGLLCAADGCPVAVEVFAGNAGDPSTVASQVDKVRKRFGIERVALVGDRGMLTTARIRKDLEPAGLDWISALEDRGHPKAAEGRRPWRPGPAGTRGAGSRRGGGDHWPGLPRRAADGLPEPAASRGAAAQAGGPAGGHGDGRSPTIAAAAARGKPGPAKRDQDHEGPGTGGQPAQG